MAFSAKMLSSFLAAKSVLLPEIITSQVWDLAFVLVKLQEVSVSLSLPHNEVLWMEAQPSAVPASFPSFVSSANTLRVLSSRSLMEMLTNVGPRSAGPVVVKYHS